MQQETPESKTNNSRSLLKKYGSFSLQMLLAILISLKFGKKVDKWMNFEKPMLVWIFPVLVILGALLLVVMDTKSKKK